MAEIRKIRVDSTDYDVRDTSKVPVNQSTANAGKIMQVGADGNLAPTAALDGKVNKTQTVNGKALNANITLDANDIPYDDDPEAERVVGSVGSALFQRPLNNQVVRVNGEQSLTDTQKATARDNIDAASAGEVSDLKSALDAAYDALLNVANLQDIDYATDLSFEIGSIHGYSYGNHGESTTTCFSLVKITSNDYDALAFDNNVYKVAFVGYATNGTYEKVGNWLTTSPIDISTITTTGDFYCVQFRRQDGSNLSASDLTSINASLHVITENKTADEIEEIQSGLYNKLEIIDFDVSGVSKVITNWKNGYVRGNDFPAWKNSTTIMTTETPISVKSGTAFILSAGYSMILIKSTGVGTRYNSSYVIDYDDTIYVEVNKIDNSNISPTERPVMIAVNWKPNNSAYVDGTNGDDVNDGSRSYPYKTIMAAVNSGKGNIYVKAGTYSEMVDLRNRYYPISIQLWDMPSYSGSVEEVPKIVIDGGENNSIYYGILANGNDRIFLSDVHCKRSSEAPFQIRNAQYVECVRCVASDSTSEKMGFQIENANGKFVDCLAYNIGKDGFNIHGYGDTEFINCIAHDCGDDGISHHDGCTGHISGGEYYNCTKGGVASPTYGAYVDVDGVYSHDNTFGIYSVSEDTGRRITKMRISNCALKNNGNVDIYFRSATGVLWNTIYDTKSIDADSTLTELN